MSKRTFALQKLGTQPWSSEPRRNLLYRWLGAPDGASAYLDFTNMPFLPDDLISFTRASNATDFSPAGTLTTETTNVPRFDYNPLTLQPRGLLVEGARTNLLLQSATLSTSPWSNVAQTISGSQPSIFGTNTGFVLTGSAANSRTVQTVTISTGVTYTYWTIVAAGTSTTANLTIDVDSAQVVGSIDFSAGTVTDAGTKAAISTIYRDLSGGKKLVGVVFSATTTTSITVQIKAGVGTLFADFAQLETGAFPSSAIITTGAAATRAADSAIITDLASIGFNANEGTISVEFESVSGAGSLNQPLFAVSDGTVNNRISSFHTSTNNIGNRIVTGGAAANPGDVSGINFAVINKMALAYGIGTNQAISCANGTLGGASSPASLPSISTYTDGFRIGAQPATFGPQGNGIWIRRLTYYPTRLPNAQLQALTA